MEVAIADRTTMHALAKAHGQAQVLAEAAVIIAQGMEFFAVGRSLNGSQINLLVEMILEDYPHETLSDIALFMRRAVKGDFEEGKTFGALDVPTMIRWWRLHLDEKAQAMERGLVAEDLAAEEMGRGILSIAGVREAVEAMSAKAKEEARSDDAIARMEKLRKHLPSMSLDELRDAWKLYPLPTERALIQAQAARMGHLGEELKVAQERIDQEAA